jgi:hypothetical protein
VTEREKFELLRVISAYAGDIQEGVEESGAYRYDEIAGDIAVIVARVQELLKKFNID